MSNEIELKAKEKYMKHIKIIKANSIKPKTETPIVVVDNETKTTRKIARNVNDWVKEYYAKKTVFSFPSLIQ